jgi:hypothetical protein
VGSGVLLGNVGGLQGRSGHGSVGDSKPKDDIEFTRFFLG